MAKAQAYRPSLLVGVGGIGSAIAQSVYKRAVETGLAAEGRIRVLTFDTDENDTRRLRDLDAKQKIRFSEARTVDDLLDRYPEVERNWFVLPRDDLPMDLRKMTLLDGAGQIRMFTRLALHDACSKGIIEQSVGSAIAELGRYDNRSGFEGQVNTLMVGSLAGATGSGSFLQIAALINELAAKRNIHADVYGLFLMPDIFVRSGAMPQGQISNVLANGYASLKEFHAATMKATERDGRFNFDFEFAPGRHLSSGDIPFSSLTLLDYEDMKGGNLGRNIPAYRMLAERAAFTLLFTPIGGRFDSVSVNDAQAKAAAAARGTHNRIAGMGLSTIVYPHDDIVDFLSDRLAVSVMEGDWLRLDRQFEGRLRRFRDQRSAGNMTVTEPMQAQSYLEDLKQLALNDQIPFFREIFDNLNPSDLDLNQGEAESKPKHLSYLEAFDDNLLHIFWDGDDVRDIKSRGAADASQFASQDALTDEVRRRENRLNNDLRSIDQVLINRPNDIVVNLFSMADDMGQTDWRDHHIQSYIVKDGPHLVQVRAFLFALRLEIEKRLSTLDSGKIRERLFRLANVFDPERGAKPDLRSSPATLQSASEISNRGFVSRLFKGGKEAFVRDYVDYYNASLRALRDFAETKLREKSYRLLLAEIDEMIRMCNGLFKEVDDMIGTLKSRADDTETRHEQAADLENVIYVCADRQCKSSFWGEVENAMAGQRLGEDVNRAIAMELYASARRNRVNREEGGMKKLKGLVRTTVVDGFAKERLNDDFLSIHNLSLIGAIRKQATLNNSEPETVLRNLIDVADRQSEVMLTLTSASDGQSIKFWAFHPALREEISLFGDADQLINPSGQGTQPVEEAEFPLNEMTSIALRVNLELSHLAKLSPPYNDRGTAAPDRAGRYYEEYQTRVNELIDAAADKRTPKSITPHIHREWHKPGLLPEISEAETNRLVDSINRAFATAILFDLLKLVVNHDRRVAQIRTIGLLATGSVSVDVAETHDMFNILKGFEQHPEAVRGCILFLKAEEKRLENSVDETILDKLKEPQKLISILRMSESRRDETTRDKRVAEVVGGFARVIHDVVSMTTPNLPVRSQFDQAEKLLKEVGESAFEEIAQLGAAREEMDVMETVFARGLEIWRGGTGFHDS